MEIHMITKNISIFEELAKSSCYDLKVSELVNDLPLTIRDALLMSDSQKIRKIISERENFSDFHRVTCANSLV